MKNLLCLLFFVIFTSSISGCMTFNQGTLPTHEALTPLNTEKKIKISLQDFYKLTNGTTPDSERGKTIGKSIIKRFAQHLKKYNIIITTDNNINYDYTATLSGYSDEQYSVMAARLTGSTLFLIPSISTIKQNVNVELTDIKNNKKFTVSATESASHVTHLVLFPLFLFQGSGIESANESMADHIYSEFYRMGAFDTLTVSQK